MEGYYFDVVPYPFKPVEAPPEYRGRPYIDPKLCIGCGACSRACPPDAIIYITDYEQGVRKIVLDVSRCIRCARCEEICPTNAVKLTREYELATPDKNDLVEIIELKLARCRICGKYLDYTERQVLKTLQIIDGLTDTEGIKDIVITCNDCRRKAVVQNTIGEGGKE